MGIQGSASGIQMPQTSSLIVIIENCIEKTHLSKTSESMVPNEMAKKTGTMSLSLLIYADT